MENIDKIIGYINEKALGECREIIRRAGDDSELIRDGYYREEQDEYWKAINAGSKELEQRRKSLNDLAAAEANKQIEALRCEMEDEAFRMAARMISELPAGEFNKLLKKAGLEKGWSAEDFVFRSKDGLSPLVLSVLFD